MRVAARSDAGLVREVNEDYVFVDPATGLAIVADGQGGVVTGVLAARLAVEALREALEKDLAHVDPEQSIRQALVKVDRIIFDAAQSEGQSLHASLVKRLDEHAIEVLEMARARRGTLRDMHAATAVALSIDGELVVAQVGHCRTYRVMHANAAPVFAISPRLMEAANMLGTAAVAPDIVRIRLLDDERLVMCSDGLHRAVDEATIAELAEGGAVDDAVCKLMEQARATSRDNVALAVLEIGGEAYSAWKNAPPYQRP